MKFSTAYKKVLFLVAFLPVVSLSILGQRHERSITTWEPVSFDIHLSFDNELLEITTATASVLVRIDENKTETVDLDFGSLKVSSVEVNEKQAPFDQHDGKLDVHLARPASKGEKLRIFISYSGKPTDGLILTKDADGRPTAIGDNWPDRVHNWIPCLDHPSAKATVKFVIAAPAADVVTANGTLVSVSNDTDGKKTWTYQEARPISAYNMVVAVGQFSTAILNKSNSSVPVSFYVSQSQGQFAEKAFAPAVPSLITFSDLVAPYPFKKLALIVGATRFGGMENANTIVFPPTFFRNFQNAPRRSTRFDIPSSMEEVEAHEIAHQWFGDTVTEKTWADLWLSEGFATYFAGLFLERNESKEAFEAYMQQKATSYLKYEKQHRTPIFDTETADLLELLNPNNYEKGCWVLHMLRGMLGDKAFFKGLRIYYKEHKDSTATSEELRSAFERASGKDLRGFFERWIYKAGHPIYKASWANIDSGKIVLSLKQMQPDEAFLQPVTLLVRTASGDRRIVVTPAGKESTVEIDGGAPQSIIVDPDGYILKEVVN